MDGCDGSPDPERWRGVRCTVQIHLPVVVDDWWKDTRYDKKKLRCVSGGSHRGLQFQSFSRVVNEHFFWPAFAVCFVAQ